MKTRYLFTILVVVLCVFSAVSQRLKVESFELNANDLSARVAQVKDLNGELCALVKVFLPVEGCKFEGNVVKQEFDVNEYHVFMVKGSKRVRLKCPGLETIDIDLTDPNGEGVTEGMTYSARLTGYENLTQNRQETTDPGHNYLIFHITPASGATLKIDGEPVAVDSKGNAASFLKYGTHHYSVEAEGYDKAEGEATVAKGESTEMNVKLESIAGRLIVECQTPGATITLNRQKKGTGRFSEEMFPGTYELTVEKEGYKPYTEVVTVTTRNTTTVNVPELTPIYGSLNVAYMPIGSTITIDGKDVGKTPKLIDGIQTGSHKVKISMDGYEDYTATIKLEEGQPGELKGSLRELQLTTSNSQQTNSQSNIDISQTIQYLNGTQTNSQSNGSVTTSLSAASGQTQGHDYVDLGLSVKWATCNIGATSPEEYGDYFAWGVNRPMKVFPFASNYMKMYKIWGNPTYDAATSQWGSSWRLPTKEEVKELIDKCKWEHRTYKGVTGCKITGPNGNSIFLPYAGQVSKYSIYSKSSIYGEGENGAYWTGTPEIDFMGEEDTGLAKSMYFERDKEFVKSNHRSCAFPIRAVTW
ncbi:MAG: PEGA domain-containing protein [Paramuribaculum sp.]|nr:PEGA domain-containing protein [Paramuribaculum sp.]